MWAPAHYTRAEPAAKRAFFSREFSSRCAVDAPARPRFVPMRIAILHSGFMPIPPLRGGAVEKMWHQLAIEFASRGHDVTQVSRHCDGLPAEEDRGGVHHRRAPGFDRPKSIAQAIWRDWRWNLRARRLVPVADVVVTNSFCAPVLLPRDRGAIYVDVQRMPKGQIGFYRRAARLRANSSAVADAIIAEAPRLAPRVRVIPNPLPFVPERAVDWTKKDKLVLYVGRLHPEKGIELLLRAWAQAMQRAAFAGWRLEIVGPANVDVGGGGEEWLHEVQRRAPAPNVTWHPAIYDPAELARFYERATIFVYPSLAEKGETFGLAALEAMAWGAVPVVSDLKCFRDFITPGENGWTFDHRGGDAVAALLAALQRAIATEPRTLAERALRVRDSHSIPAIAEKFLADFAQLS